jgi:hypothetical protein
MDESYPYPLDRLPAQSEETKYWRCFRASKRLRKIKIRRNKKSLITPVILAQNAIILK